MLIRGKCKFFFVIPAYETSCLIFGRQWYWITFLSWPLCCKQLKFPGNFSCLQLSGSIVSRTKVWKNRRLANFRARDSKYSLTTRCWQYHNSRGGVREMSLRTKTILPGVRKGNFVTWSAGCRSYFFSSRKPANVNVQKHAKRARACIFKHKWKSAKQIQAKPSHRKRNSKVKWSNRPFFWSV